LPARFSELGLFRSLPRLDPAPGLVPYEVNVPQWADRAVKRRFIALPDRGTVSYVPTGQWRLPAGTVLVENLERGRRLELRLLVVDGAGAGFGAAYRWRADGTDADLVEEGERWESDEGGKKSAWYSPGPLECLSCHSPAAGVVLGLSARQLNRSPGTGGPNQIRDWASRGILDPAPREEEIAPLARLIPWSDRSSPLELRVRSYLDANCSGCHRPNGAGRGLLDARFDTPLGEQNLVGSALVAGDLGLKEARNIVRGEVGRSVLYERMKRRGDPFRMPPVGSLEPDPEALESLARWIEDLAEKPKTVPGANHGSQHP
jgi:mono/diheme cytochrome c family protein